MNIESVVEWYFRPRTPQLTAERAIELFFQFHPRTAFLKMQPKDASLVDIGAGDGSLSIFKRWIEPARNDIEMHAYSIEKGTHFDDFASYEISDWNTAQPQFAGKRFNAILSAHFIEHVQQPESLAQWASDKLLPGGRLYVEWPSPASLSMPRRDDLAKHGVQVLTSRFDDDATHRQELPDRAAFIRALENRGLEIEQTGIISLPWLEDELMAHYRDAADVFPRQAAFWSWSRWSQFVVAKQR